MNVSSRWRSAVLCGATIGLLLVGGGAWAHPLGNFTISRHSELRIYPDRIVLHYAVDMAEIPTTQELDEVDRDRDGQTTADELERYAQTQADDLLRGLRAETDTGPLRFVPRSARADLSKGQGNLQVLRLDVLYRATPTAGFATVRYGDLNFVSFLGWKEIIAVAGEGLGIANSNVPEASISDSLHAYPKDRLDDPLDQRAAVVTVAREKTGSTVAPRPNSGEAGHESEGDRLGELVADAEGPVALAAAILFALGLGAVHAVGPGHGKTIMAAYLLGARGRPRDAFLIGAAVSVMHTASVIVLGIVTLSATRLFPADRVFPWLELVSGVLVLSLGVWLFVGRIRTARHHGHEHTHELPTTDPLSWRGLGVIALSGGLLPSPTALVVLLGAIALHRVLLGVVLVAAFSVGLAAALTFVGLAVMRARTLVTGRWEKWERRLPIVASAVIAVLGGALTVRAIGHL